ncbi:cell division protein ZapA [Spirochaetia bacterium 38H-sp]|uniref:Cell division protein ZapA n=1 Tax=Rarispira pelagica TaxID=3141764 RepID=A0ABU9UD09_9SPIR
MERSIDVNILGTSFKIKTDENPEYVKSVLELYKNKVEHIKTTLDIDEPIKIAILSGIMLADELMQKDTEYSKKLRKNTEEIEQIAEKLIKEIDQALS